MSFTEDENRHERESGHNEGECSCCSCSANENIFCECEEDENEERAAFSRELKFLSAAGIIFFLLLITDIAADFRFRLAGDHKPLPAWAGRLRFGGDDLDLIAVF